MSRHCFRERREAICDGLATPKAAASTFRFLAAMAVFSVLAASSCSTFTESEAATDDWFGADKAAHFLVSAGGSFGIASIRLSSAAAPTRAREALGTVSEAVGLSTAGIFSLGIAKETSDALRRGGSGWSWRDLVWDVAGCLTGGLFAAVLWCVASR